MVMLHTCPYCNKEFYGRVHRKICFSKECALARHNEISQRYKKSDIQRTRRQYIESRTRLRELWGCRPCPDGKQVNGKRSVKDGREIYVKALPVLEEYGFYNIFDERHGLTQSLAGDCIATKAGKNCIIEVTCALQHRIDRHKALANRLGIELYVLFVKRDTTKFILKKVDINSSAACVTLSETRIKACFALSERLLMEQDNKIIPLPLVSKDDKLT